VRCLRGLAAKFKASEQRRCFKFNRLLADCKPRGVNLGFARLCSGSKKYKSRRKNKPRSLGLASGFYRRSTISRLLYGVANIIAAIVFMPTCVDSALQYGTKARLLIKFSRELLRRFRACA